MRKTFCKFLYSNFMVQTMNMSFWCLKYDVENSYKIMRCHDKEDDKANLCSYRDDVLDIAYYSRKEGKLPCIEFEEGLISQYDKDMTSTL